MRKSHIPRDHSESPSPARGRAVNKEPGSDLISHAMLAYRGPALRLANDYSRASQAAPSADAERVFDFSQGTCQPLAGSERSFVKPRLGFDLGNEQPLIRLRSARNGVYRQEQSPVQMEEQKPPEWHPAPVPPSQPAQAPAPSVYPLMLRQAVSRLEEVQFGRAEEEEKFDKEFWEIEESNLVILSLKMGKRPSDAIDAMFRKEKLKEWSVDCSQYVQVAHFFALRHTLGTEAFNQRMGKGMKFRIHDSTGIRSLIFFKRESPSEQMTNKADQKKDPRSVKEILEEAPVGSRVMWTNLEIDPAGDKRQFRNENTLKLGPNSFAAHGFQATVGKSVFTRLELERQLGLLSRPEFMDSDLKKFVFIAQIEHYEMP